MHVIAIGWLYVTLLMAATEPNFTAGVLTFVFYGGAPLALWLWLFGRRPRKRPVRVANAAGGTPEPVAEPPREP
jgi:hypothetical protein